MLMIGVLKPDVDVDAELTRIRATFVEEAVEEFVYFYIRVIGGNWQYTHLGLVVDSYGGFTRRDVSLNWCIVYSFPQRIRFNFACYTEAGSHILAR